MSCYLSIINVGFQVQIHSFVLMSNHFHFIASFPEANLSQAMQYFMQQTSRHISASAGHINQIYGNRVFRSELSSHRHFENVYKYVYRNPVEAGLSLNVEDYEYSTLHGLIGSSHLRVPVIEDTILFEEKFSLENLKWLNTPTSEKHRIDMKNALRKPQFKLRKINHKANELDFIKY